MSSHSLKSSYAALLCSAFYLGCAGYEGATAEMHSALLAGDRERAMAMSDKALKVDKDDDTPEKLVGTNSLLLLERAMIKQAMQQYKSSSADFGVSDKNLELLDLQNDALGNIGQFIFSDDATHYQAPAYEKLLLNTFNMLSYMAAGDMEGARVESRRLRVMEKYLSAEQSEQIALSDLGNYLAGVAFEAASQKENALEFYSDALKRHTYESLAEPIRRLASCTGVKDETIDKFIESHGGPLPQCTPMEEGKGTLIVVSGIGLVPRKTAVRLPVGIAVAVAGAFLLPSDIVDLNRLIARGLVTWVNFPELKPPKGLYTTTRVQVDGNDAPLEMGSDISKKVVDAWNSIKPKLMAAAIVRMITRLAAGIATEVAVTKASGNEIGGLLAGLAVQGAMTAFDTPDTRSWTTLPSAVHIARIEVSAGAHEVRLEWSGNGSESVTTTVNVPKGGFAVISASSMR